MTKGARSKGADLAHLEDFFSLCTDILCVLDADYAVLLVNPAFCETTGLDASEVEGHSFLGLFHEEDGGETSRALASLLEGDGRESFSNRLRRKDGTLLLVDWRIRRHPTSGCLYLVGRDLSEHRRTVDALRDAEQNVHSLLEAAGQGILSVDQRGHIVWMNSMAERLFGYASQELVGKSVETLVPSGLAEAHAAHRGKYFAKPRTRPMGLGLDLLGRRKDGTEFPVEISLSTMSSRDGHLVVAFVSDITERKRAESEKARLEHRLEHATKMEAVGRLAGGIAHDFNNLLTALSGFAEIVLDELPETSPLYEGARETFKTCQRSTSLVRRLLAVSRRQMLQPELLNLNAKIGEIEKILVSVLGEDIELMVKLAPGLGFVRADQSQIEQVILNLVVNARDAMPTGGRLVIGTSNVDVDKTMPDEHVGLTPGAHVLLTVSDTGHGMDQDTLEHIFEPFFTTKEKGKGTGLGLASVYGIVHQSGGQIWAYSEPGQGTTFKIYLPRVDATGHRVEPEAGLSKEKTGSETVLVTEDENTVRLITVGNLRRAGYRVLEARDGEEAIRIAEAHDGPIHLVLTDVIMPRVNGPALVKRLAESRPRIKTLYMSGHADDALVHHGIAEESLSFLEKPFTREELLTRVRRVLDES